MPEIPTAADADSPEVRLVTEALHRSPLARSLLPDGVAQCFTQYVISKDPERPFGYVVRPRLLRSRRSRLLPHRRPRRPLAKPALRRHRRRRQRRHHCQTPGTGNRAAETHAQPGAILPRRNRRRRLGRPTQHPARTAVGHHPSYARKPLARMASLPAARRPRRISERPAGHQRHRQP